MDIEKLRFKDRLNYEIEVHDQIKTEKSMIPTMLLQPIVENAVNHGIFNKDMPGNVSLIFKYNHDNDIVVEILDDGVGMVNTRKKINGKINSGDVLRDKIFHLNRSGKWNIHYTTSEAFSDRRDKGTKVTFTINRL